MGSIKIIPPSFRRIGHSIAIAFVVAGVSACSSLDAKLPFTGQEEVTTESAHDLDLIAANLVNSLSQFPHLNPLMATVQVAEPDSDFDRQVQSELDNRGFKLERVDTEGGINRVVPQVTTVPSGTGLRQLYVLAIGQVSVERAFDVIEQKTVPASEQVIRGTTKRTVSLNDEIFSADTGEEYASVSFMPYTGPTISDVLSAKVPSADLDLENGSAQTPIVKHNVYETTTSNYQSLFTGYEDVEQSILVFPNDSLRMGEVNKQIIESFVDKMDPETDLLSVIGCSHGQTEISNGNSVLALGRANRVKEALLFSGIDHDKVLEEGCWAPTLFDEVMPRRGVVLTLKRQVNS